MCSYSRVWVEKKKVKWSNTDYKRCTDDTVDRKLFDPEKWFDGTKFGLKNEDTEKNDQIRWRGGGLRIAAAPTTPSVANWISRINKKFPHFSSPCAISRFLPVGINWPADPPPPKAISICSGANERLDKCLHCPRPYLSYDISLIIQSRLYDLKHYISKIKWIKQTYFNINTTFISQRLSLENNIKYI